MRIHLATTDLSLITNFIITAESEAEILILRMVCNKSRLLRIHSFGGNIGEKVYSMCIGLEP